MIEINKIFLDDCISRMKTFPDDSFDHCITDPPYNISGYDNKKEIGWYKSCLLYTSDAADEP